MEYVGSTLKKTTETLMRLKKILSKICIYTLKRTELNNIQINFAI